MKNLEKIRLKDSFIQKEMLNIEKYGNFKQLGKQKKKRQIGHLLLNFVSIDLGHTWIIREYVEEIFLASGETDEGSTVDHLFSFQLLFRPNPLS